LPPPFSFPLPLLPSSPPTLTPPSRYINRTPHGRVSPYSISVGATFFMNLFLSFDSRSPYFVWV
jgi:hypothetical protein